VSFDEAFTQVIGLEGGYVNDPADPGGQTKYGISKRAYPNVDIANLKLGGAKQIYLDDYWNKLDLSSVQSQVATEVFEQAVNMGTTQAVLHLQQALLMLGFQVYVDGVMGGQTISAANRANVTDLVRVMNGLQFMRYWNIASSNPSQKKFFRGWLRRLA
jgi:lysozyme family protein